jgi:hypothetical protein
MKNLRDLQGGTERLRRNGNEDDVRLSGVILEKMSLFVPNQTLLFSGTVLGSDSKHRYIVNIEFSGVKINPPDTFGVVVTIPLNRSVEVQIQQLKQNKDFVKVSCSCQDYQFTWEFLNNEEECHYGSLQSYKRKTKTHQPRNRLKVIGLCKHLDIFIDLLIREKYLS